MGSSFWSKWRSGGAWRRGRKESDPTLQDAHADSRARLCILLANGLATVLVTWVLFPNLLADGWRFVATGEAQVERLPLVVFAACLMPPVLARLCYSLIDHRAERQPITVEIPAGLAPRLRQRVGLTWAYEKQRACWSLSRAALFASMWGLTGTLTLLGGVYLSLPFLEGMDFGANRSRALVAFAVTSAAGTRFLFDLAKICVRTGTDDASKRMFSEALRGLLYAVLVAGVAASMAPELGLDISGPALAVALGSAIAILGASSMTHLQQRLAVAFGLGRVEIANLTPLSAIAGCSPAELERLRDEGIESAEALINTPVPRIFLSTRFSLQRICDWIDRGRLLCLLGVGCAADLRAKTGIVGVLALRDLCMREPDRAGAVLAQAMRLGKRSEASTVIQTLVDDDDVTLLDAFSQALPRLGTEHDGSSVEGAPTSPIAARPPRNAVSSAAAAAVVAAMNGHHPEPPRNAPS